MIPSLCAVLIRLHPEYCIQLWGSQHKKIMELLEQIQRRTTKITNGLEHLFSEDRLRKLEEVQENERGCILE